MTVRRKTVFFILALCVFGVGARTFVVVTDPLRRSDAEVREWLLKKAPLGSSFEQVRAVAIRNDWKIAYEDPFNPREPVVGERIIRFEVGHFHAFMIPFHVLATYRFLGDRLVEINRIERIGDSI